MNSKNQYKPSSADLARATRELWNYLDDSRVLAELREVNGTILQPGDATQRELLQFCFLIVDAWTEKNFGNSGAKKFLANLARRGLLNVEPASKPGLPSRYRLGIDPATGKTWDEESFCTTAYEGRKAAYKPAQTKPKPAIEEPAIDMSDLMADLRT